IGVGGESFPQHHKMQVTNKDGRNILKWFFILILKIIECVMIKSTRVCRCTFAGFEIDASLIVYS
ncbi:MAG: hypothetical protein ABJA70_19625, partial [Chryseolinea sp.]